MRPGGARTKMSRSGQKKHPLQFSDIKVPLHYGQNERNMEPDEEWSIRSSTRNSLFESTDNIPLHGTNGESSRTR
jgi:hypothetical protein